MATLETQFAVHELVVCKQVSLQGCQIAHLVRLAFWARESPQMTKVRMELVAIVEKGCRLLVEREPVASIPPDFKVREESVR